jgi:cytochrome c6
MTWVFAIVIALATTTPAPTPSSTPNSYRDGPTIYAQECMSCHGNQGQGSDGNPSLAGNGGVTGNDYKRVISIVMHGRRTMPAFSPKLSDAEIAAVVTYIRTAWGNEGTSVDVYEVDDVHR